MTTVSEVKSLAMLKMEKNFVAVIDKGYTRHPYSDYIVEDMMDWFLREVKELVEAIESGTAVEVRNEIADCSNILDYMYEGILREEER